MSVLVELHNTEDATIRTEVQATVEHVLSDRPGQVACRLLDLVQGKIKK